MYYWCVRNTVVLAGDQGYPFLSAGCSAKNKRVTSVVADSPVCAMDRHASKPEGKTKRPPKVLVGGCLAHCC